MFEIDRTGFAMLSLYFTENSVSQLWKPTPVRYQNVRRFCVKVLQLLIAIMGMWQTCVKIPNVKFYDYPSSGSRVVGTDSLPSFLPSGLTDRHMVKLISLFGIASWTLLCAVYMCVCVGGLQFLNQLTVFNEIWHERYATGATPITIIFLDFVNWMMTDSVASA
jgi:hypothetical protein